MTKRRDKICGCVLGAIGLLALIGGIIILALLPQLVRQLVEKDVALKDGSFTERTWQAPPFKISMQFWIFNVTNTKQVLLGARPSLEQKGPYGFREQQVKQMVTFSSDGNTVSYVNRKDYFFDPTLSCSTCLETDKFTVPNIPYLTVLKMIRDQTPGSTLAKLLQWILNLIGEGPFAFDISAKELLFEGYRDKIFDMINFFKKGAVPDRMGLFYGKNSTDDGLYEVRTGADDAYSVGRIVNWRNHSALFWTNWWRQDFPQSNMINGSDGTVYPPFIKRSDLLPIFITDICRSLYVTFNSNVKFRDLSAYRFIVPEEVFDEDAPANQGFCWPSPERYYKNQPQVDQGWCLPSGMLDVSRCQSGAPIVVTSPQFLFCPDEVKDSVKGLYPDTEEFYTFADIEPTTGVVLAGARKIQLNVAMYTDQSKLAAPTLFNRMRSVIVPIVWLNESVQIDENTYNYVYQNVVVDQRNAHIGAYVAMGIGVLFVLLLAAFIAYRVVQDRKQRAEEGRWSVLPEPEVSAPDVA